MADIDKISGIAAAGIDKVSGTANASIDKVSGMTMPSGSVEYYTMADALDPAAMNGNFMDNGTTLNGKKVYKQGIYYMWYEKWQFETFYWWVTGAAGNFDNTYASLEITSEDAVPILGPDAANWLDAGFNTCAVTGPFSS